MKIHIISDTHFNHKNIKEYCNRPDDWEDKIFKGLQESANAEPDILIHLGDVSLGFDALRHEFITTIFKRSWLILGNHDGKSMNWYMNHGWDFVGRSVMIYLYGIRILFSHRPYPFPPMKTVTSELRRQVAFSEEMIDKPRSNFDINVHGHCHNRPNLELETWQKPFILENQDYKPVDLKEFLSEEIRNKQQSRSLQKNI